MILPNGDSAILIVPDQMDAINNVVEMWKGQRIYIDTLRKQKTEYQTLVKQQDSILVIRTTQRDEANQSAISCNTLLTEANKYLEKAARRIKWLRIQRGIGGVVIVVETVLLLFTDI